MSYDDFDDFDELLDQLDEVEGEAGIDEHTEEATARLPYIGLIQERTEVPVHIKRLAGDYQFGFSTAHVNEEGNPFYEYISELHYMVIASLTSMRGKVRVGGRKFQVPFNDTAGEITSVFPDSSQVGNGYGQACRTWNGIFPSPRFEGDVLRDPRTGQLYKIGWSNDGSQHDIHDICAMCPFSKWLDHDVPSAHGGRKPLCSPSWTWPIYVLPGQIGTDAEGNEVEIRSGLYRLTGNNASVQTALFGVSAEKRDGSPRWGALKIGEGIAGINALTKVTGSVTVNLPLSVKLSKRQQVKATGDIINAKGVIVDRKTAEKHPDKHFHQIVSPLSKLFPEGKPELVGDVPVFPLVMNTQQNNNKVNGRPSPASVPVTRVSKTHLTPEEYLGYLRAWIEYNQLHKDELMALAPGDYLAAQERTAGWQLESGENEMLPEGIDAESEEINLD